MQKKSKKVTRTTTWSGQIIIFTFVIILQSYILLCILFSFDFRCMNMSLPSTYILYKFLNKFIHGKSLGSLLFQFSHRCNVKSFNFGLQTFETITSAKLYLDITYTFYKVLKIISQEKHLSLLLVQFSSFDHSV